MLSRAIPIRDSVYPDGDVNFMPVLAATRVISQHLEQTYDLLEPLFKTAGAAIS